MSQWNLIIDVARCVNCNNCVLANKDEFVGNEFPGYSAPQALHGPSTIRIERKVRGQGHMVDAAYLPLLCNHCDDAPCVKQSSGAITKRADGIVIVDPLKAKGRKELVATCPYGAMVWNEEQSVPQQWIFDAHLLDKGWQEPRCTHSCPTGALRAVKADAAQMAERVRAEGLKVLKPELNTRPRVYYKNLYRFTDCFIGGSALVREAGRLECVQGATVELIQEGKTVARTSTDAFGDFRFDGLGVDSGKWQIRVTHPEHGGATAEAVLGTTQVLGELLLSHTGEQA
ncbi:MAG: oxidoreductase [Burkholderiaceae bacterium]|jgi:Fe-S-cluster-containing dehydrogenase component|nr:oxidoreductase [Burkholderiaceae bacterium]